jgi:hypothetical protein
MVDRFCWINACKHAETYFDLWSLAVLAASIDGECVLDYLEADNTYYDARFTLIYARSPT